MKNLSIVWILVVVTVLFSCSSTKENKKAETMNDTVKPAAAPSPPAIIYKTKADYYYNVPVTLNEAKTKIVSFPDFSDLKRNGEFVYPTRLANGWLLDNRGIGKNSAFLRFTYQDYYNMDNIPSADRLMNYITDKDPFTEMYDCGLRGNYDNITEEINEVITSGQLDAFKRLIPEK